MDQSFSWKGFLAITFKYYAASSRLQLRIQSLHVPLESGGSFYFINGDQFSTFKLISKRLLPPYVRCTNSFLKMCFHQLFLMLSWLHARKTDGRSEWEWRCFRTTDMYDLNWSLLHSQAVLPWLVDTIIYPSVQGHYTDWWIRHRWMERGCQWGLGPVVVLLRVFLLPIVFE